MRSEKGQSPGKVEHMKRTICPVCGGKHTEEHKYNASLKSWWLCRDCGLVWDDLPAVVYKWADMVNAFIIRDGDGWAIDSPFCNMPEHLTTEELVAFCTEELEEIRKAGGC